MKNKKGYYIDFDKSGKVDAIYAIFDESELVKVLNFETKKFHNYALSESSIKEYPFLKECVFVNEELFQYFKKRYLDNDVSKCAQLKIYSACFESTGAVSNIYRQDVGKVEVIDDSGSWKEISEKTNGYMKSTTIDYETFIFLTQNKNPENYLRNLKYMGKNVTEDLFHDKVFVRSIEDMLSGNACSLSFPVSVRLKYSTINEIKDVLFPKKNGDGKIWFGMDFGLGLDATVFGQWPVYKEMPSLLPPRSITNLWVDEITKLYDAPNSKSWIEEFVKFNPNEGLFAQLEKEFDDIIDFKNPSIHSIIYPGKIHREKPDAPQTKYLLSWVVKTITGEESKSKIGYSTIDRKRVSEKLIQAIAGNKHLIVRNAENEIIAFYNKELVSRMSFTILTP